MGNSTSIAQQTGSLAPCPLPYLIPDPGRDSDLCKKFEAIGLKFLFDHPRSQHRDNRRHGLVKYELPQDWKLVDKAKNEYHPLWYIIDDQGMKRGKISGSWQAGDGKGLSLAFIDNPAKYDSSDESED